MLIEKYKGKNVKLFVSSDSGAGVATSTAIGGRASLHVNSMLVVCGKLVDMDDRYIELTTAQSMRPTMSCSYVLDGDSQKLENYQSMILNQDKIISIALLDE